MIEKFSQNSENLNKKPVEENSAFFNKLLEIVGVEKPEFVKKSEQMKKVWENIENVYPSTYEERIGQTPTDKDTERGTWEEKRGESKYIPIDKNIKEIIEKYGIDGIVYSNGVPDFSKCSESTVEIEKMTEKRQGKGNNFDKADQKCAEQWNEENKGGKSDWTSRDVADWRRENGYTWHECNDRKTCQLIPTEINDYFGHLGGVGECKKANLKEDKFDE